MPPAPPRGSSAERPVVVVLRALGLGDLLTGVPALRAIASAFPEHRRVLAAPAVLGPLAALSGAVDEVADTAPLAPLPARLHGADVAVNLHGRGPQSHRVLMEARPGRLIAFAHPEIATAAAAPRWRRDEHEVARWCRMLAESGIPAEPSALDLPVSPDRAPTGTRGATLVHPGAAGLGKRWPVRHWATVARAEQGRGNRVIVTGGPGEVELAREVARGAGLSADRVLAGRTELLDLAALVAAAGLVLCADTGVGHLATAAGTPSVVLFGPTSPTEWGPPPVRPQHRALHAPHGDLGALRPDEVLAAAHQVRRPAAVAGGTTPF